MVGKEKIYSKKVCMLGTFAVGKTSLVRRFVERVFNDSYLSTIGAQVYQKKLDASTLQRDAALNIVLWDLANIETLTGATKTYFNGSAAALVVVDLSRPDTFDMKPVFIDAFLQTNPDAAILFCGNKKDLFEDEPPNMEQLAKLAEKYNSKFLLSSARTGEGVDELFTMLGQNIVDKL